MPVGAYPKDEIRQMAEEAGLPVAHKKDSQEICFIPDHDYAAFIERESGKTVPGPGNFVSADGKSWVSIRALPTIRWDRGRG